MLQTLLLTSSREKNDFYMKIIIHHKIAFIV